MPRSGHQRSYDGERLRSEGASNRRAAKKVADDLAARGPAHVVASISLFAAAPADTAWKACDGSSLSKFDYPELFDEIGTTYGGTGSNFALPTEADTAGGLSYYIYAGKA